MIEHLDTLARLHNLWRTARETATRSTPWIQPEPKLSAASDRVLRRCGKRGSAPDPIAGNSSPVGVTKLQPSQWRPVLHPQASTSACPPVRPTARSAPTDSKTHIEHPGFLNRALEHRLHLSAIPHPSLRSSPFPQHTSFPLAAMSKAYWFAAFLKGPKIRLRRKTNRSLFSNRVSWHCLVGIVRFRNTFAVSTRHDFKPRVELDHRRSKFLKDARVTVQLHLSCCDLIF